MKTNCIFLALCLALRFAVPLAQSDDKAPKVPPPPPKAIIDEVGIRIKNLGADGFKTRRKATKRLIEIAKTETKKGGKPSKPYEAYIAKQMEKLVKDKDPEIAHRAKKILKSLNYGAHIHPDIVGMLTLKLDNDLTLSDISELFETKIAWVKAANAGLKTEKDLAKFKAIRIPIPKGSEWTDSIGEDIEVEIEESIEEF